ncbi:MAG: hypothetical protein H8F28_02765 [Fibrella sp.]|nr:hypothetical protein [Armatimonadota bacterium]
MNDTRLKPRSGVVPATAVVALLFLLVYCAGCANKKTTSDAEARRDFLAPTDVNKLTPEARAHLPGGGKFQPTGTSKKQ